MLVCGDCGRENPEGSRFCNACAAPLETRNVERRKLVTIVFSDLEGSTSLGERLDSESLRVLLGRYFAAMSEAVEQHGGTVEKFIGDAVMAVFGVPITREDDALRAVRAALAMREAQEGLNDEFEREFGVRLRVRTGINTGEVVTGDASRGQPFATGDAVNVAARLETSAAAGEILLGDETHRVVRDAVDVEPVQALRVKGKSEPLVAFCLLRLRTEAQDARRLKSRLVARKDELRALQEEFDRVEARRECRLVTVVGSAGIGKSRLVHEFTSGISERAMALRGRCLSYGQGITFWPLAEIVRQAAAITDDDAPAQARAKLDAVCEVANDGAGIAERVAAMIGLSDARLQREELFWGIRALLEALAEPRPLVVIIDDLQWAEPALVEFIEYLLASATERAVLLVCLARPELGEHRPGLLTANRTRTTIALQPLDDRAGRELIEGLLGSTALSRELSRRVSDTAQGNPLFVSEFVRMLIDDQVLRRDNGDWVIAGDLPEIKVPASIEALLAARLDRLPHEQRAVAERASIIGQEFTTAGLGGLSDADADTGPALAGLVRKEIVSVGGHGAASEDTYRFSHILIRDVAYAGLLKQTRAAWHERFAGWLEDHGHDRLGEFEEIVGHHLEQAFRYREGLAPVDDTTRTLAMRAFERLASAGRRAALRGDNAAAVTLLERAHQLTVVDAEKRLVCAVDLIDALRDALALERAQALIDETVRLARRSGNELVATRAELQGGLIAWQKASRSPDDLSALARNARGVCERAGDDAGVAVAWLLEAQTHFLRVRIADSAHAAEQGLLHARRAGDRRVEDELLHDIIACLAVGPTPVDTGIERCQEILREATVPARARMNAANFLGWLHGMRGDFERGRELLAQARDTYRRLGLTASELGTMPQLAELEMLAGRPAVAERELRAAVAALTALGERGWLSTEAAMLAEAILAQGREDDAAELLEKAIEVGADEDVITQVIYRRATARLLVQQGEVETAQRVAHEALDLVSTTDDLYNVGLTVETLAAVLTAAGRDAEAVVALEHALDVFTAKGVVPACDRVARSLHEAIARRDRTA